MKRLWRTPLSLFTTGLVAAALLTSNASAQLVDFFEDFESIDRTVGTALSDTGWQLFAAGINGNASFPDFGAGPFPAPNDIANPQISVISDFPSGGDPPAGNQGLVIFSDYNNSLHSDPNDPRDLVINVFQEQIISASDIGDSVVFSFLADGNAVPPSGSATAEAYIITLDPSNNFVTTNSATFDTTSLMDGDDVVGSLSINLTDPALVGQILQYGFRNTSQNFDGTAVDYDNVSLEVIGAGDFNGDGSVDAIDYTLWRDNLGAFEPDVFVGGGSGDGLVSIDDYLIWKANFGGPAPAAGTLTATPEPSSAMLLLAGMAACCRRRR